ncbi:uncharacterized protein VTP21DRAFT_5132 [Calcarisporiella thermophila]|uniref:uncharacterized protein n=1 Tax=Calcarisporiella thermophila TaxID=911321 RepID=UPI003742A11A
MEREIEKINEMLTALNELRTAVSHIVDTFRIDFDPTKVAASIQTFKTYVEIAEKNLTRSSSLSHEIQGYLHNLNTTVLISEISPDENTSTDKPKTELGKRDTYVQAAISIFNKHRSLSTTREDNDLLSESITNIAKNKHKRLKETVENWRENRQKPCPVNIIWVSNPNMAGISGLVVTIGKIMKSNISLSIDMHTGVIDISRVVTFGYKEEKESWEESDLIVFKKISHLATDVVEYGRQWDPNNLLIFFLDWLWSYNNLFTQPCRNCGQLLIFDSPHYKFLPPVMRTFKDKQFREYHIQCI